MDDNDSRKLKSKLVHLSKNNESNPKPKTATKSQLNRLKVNSYQLN